MGKVKKLTKKDLNELKDLLLSHQAQIQGDVRSIQDDIDSARGSSGSFSKVPTHPSDVGADNFEQDFTYERLQAEGYELADIKTALSKIEEGQYGVCEECGENIKKMRLKALPYCKYCISCQEKIETQGA